MILNIIIEGLILSNGCIVGEACNNEDDDHQHHDQCQNILGVTQYQVRRDQQDDCNQVGNAGVGAGF